MRRESTDCGKLPKQNDRKVLVGKYNKRNKDDYAQYIGQTFISICHIARNGKNKETSKQTAKAVPDFHTEVFTILLCIFANTDMMGV